MTATRLLVFVGLVACAPATQAPLVRVGVASARIPACVSREAMIRATERVLAIRSLTPHARDAAGLVTTSFEEVEPALTVHEGTVGVGREKRTRRRRHALVVIVRDKVVEVRVTCRERPRA